MCLSATLPKDRDRERDREKDRDRDRENDKSVRQTWRRRHKDSCKSQRRSEPYSAVRCIRAPKSESDQSNTIILYFNFNIKQNTVINKISYITIY